MIAQPALPAVVREACVALGRAIVLLVCLLAAWSPVFAQTNAIESVSSAREGGTSWLRIALRAPPAALPASFAIADPPRIVLDLADTVNATGSSTIEFAQGDVRSVAIAEAGGRARLVLNLERALAYRTTIDGSALVVALEPAAGAPAHATSGATRASRPGLASRTLLDIDFRRGPAGEGRVLVELSDPAIGVDMRRQGASIVVDFPGASLPDNLRRRLEVGDFGTPVRAVSAFERDGHARLVIEPSGNWEHNAYQRGTEFVVEVKPLREEPAPHAGGAARQYQGERLTLNFQDIGIRALLQVIADFTDLNIVTTDSVSGNLTLRLENVPWDQALDIVLDSKGLAARRNGNVLMVAPREELAAKERLELEARRQMADIEPLRTETFQLNYQKADEVRKLLGNEQQPVLSERGSVVVDQRTNKVFVQDTPSRLEAVRRVIEQVDVPVRQVLIEARIVEADDRFTRNLGVKLGYNDLTWVRGSTGNAHALVSGNLSGVTDLSPQLGRLTAVENTNFVNLPAANLAGTDPASFAISLFGSSLTRFLNLELSALEADRRGKVVSSPRVLTADQGTAVIEQGTELPYQQATSSGATAVQFRKANLRLAVTPQITPEGNVIMDVEVNRDAVGQITPAGFAIDTRRVQTQVLVEDGGTVVIGGIYEQVERDQTNKVPLLGDIPVVGYAFRNNTRTDDRAELLVFLTPRVVSGLSTAR